MSPIAQGVVVGIAALVFLARLITALYRARVNAGIVARRAEREKERSRYGTGDEG